MAEVDISLGSESMLSEHDNQIHPSTGKLDLPTGLTNEALVQHLITAPEDQLHPWEECSIPSLGSYYGWTDGLVKVRPMTQKAESILSTQRLAQSGQSIAYLIDEFCKFPDGFKAEDLLLGDQVFLLYYLRGITHGNVYEFAVTCPSQECGTTSTHKYDLNLLAQTVTWADRQLGPEPFKIDLPYLSEATGRPVWVSVRFLRVADSSSIMARRKAKQKAVRPGNVGRLKGRGVDPRQQQAASKLIDDAITENLERIIVNVMGVESPNVVRSFIERLHAKDAATIREWLREHTPGIDNTIEIQCPDCSQDFTIELPITESFFRPTQS